MHWMVYGITLILFAQIIFQVILVSMFKTKPLYFRSMDKTKINCDAFTKSCNLVFKTNFSSSPSRGCCKLQSIWLKCLRISHSLHLSLIAPSSVSNSVRDGGTFGGPQFFTFSSAKSHENCLHFKVAPVINDKKHPKHLVVTGALHVIQWIWGPQNHPSKSLLWMRQLKKCAWEEGLLGTGT